MKTIRKQVDESWGNSRNPNLFGGALVLGPSGRIVSIDTSSYGFVAEVFEDEYVQEQLLKAFRKNNIHYKGFNDEDLDKSTKKNIDSWPRHPLSQSSL